MPALNPEILTWARTTAGLSLGEASKAIDLNEAHNVSKIHDEVIDVNVLESRH